MNSFDQNLLEMVLTQRASGLNGFFLSVTHLGDKEVIALLTFALAVGAWIAGFRLRPLGLVAVVGLSALTSEALKQLGQRERPFETQVVKVQILEGTIMPDSRSFPSGHATLAAALFVGAALLAPNMSRSKRLRLAVLGFMIAFFVGLSRVYLGLHWPTDVVTGWSIGVGWSFIGAWVLDIFGPAREGPAGTYNAAQPNA